MVNDTIINFVTDVYESYNDSYDINNYKDNTYFMNIHSENLYEYFEYIKRYIIKTFINNEKFDEKTIYNFKITREIIHFFIPSIDVLKSTVLYNFDDDIVQRIWENISNINNGKSYI